MEQKKISFVGAVLLSINIMVGAGIFSAVGPMSAAAGSISFLGWLIVGLLFFPIVWGVAKAAQLFPGEGGFYHYCSSGLNSTAGFIAHWAYLLGYISVAASLITLLRNGVIHQVGIEFFRDYPFAFNLLIVTFYTLINMISLDKIDKLQSAATLLKITPIVMIIVLFAFYYNPELSFESDQLGSLGLTISAVIFSYTGFESCCSVASLLKDGPKKVASVILTAFFITLALYFSFHIGLIHIMGPDNLATHGAIAFPRFLGLSSTWANALQVGIATTILFIWANSILGVSLGNITNIYSLGSKNLILGDKLLATLNDKQRPIYAAIAHGIALLGLITCITDIDILFALTNSGIIGALILTLCAVFLYQFKAQQYFQMSITLLGFGSCGIFIYFIAIQIPSVVYVLPLIIGMAVGLVLFKVKSKQHSICV